MSNVVLSLIVEPARIVGEVSGELQAVDTLENRYQSYRFGFLSGFYPIVGRL